MVWQMFRVTYELRSHLSIGYHKVGNVQPTRYYVPARNFWGAVTERLTRRGFRVSTVLEGDYRAVGEWIKEHCAFSYFFVCEGDTLLVPSHREDGLRFGEMSKAEFERHYLDVQLATALDCATTSAETGSLHEVEFITPYRLQSDEPYPTQLSGWAFLDEVAREELGNEGKWRKWLGQLQVGGERRYGFGHLWVTELQSEQSLASYAVRLNADRPQVKVPAAGVLLAHAVAEGVEARGMVEPLVGRETSKNSARFGTILTSGRICWVPGSVVSQETSFQICETGIWSKIP